ncbi:uncharacterized protein LOC101846974 [Aplysia californica]|uniref:Pseudouridylate synthase RPUSD4, mitochondrial n=1 Tax=Aplysia californica TaxID=6500 RepID=A0ABM0JVJ4_APLCA|nr:uncharacterized protein LOC101846974 [Aplysia californica]
MAAPRRLFMAVDVPCSVITALRRNRVFTSRSFGSPVTKYIHLSKALSQRSGNGDGNGSDAERSKYTTDDNNSVSDSVSSRSRSSSSRSGAGSRSRSTSFQRARSDEPEKEDFFGIPEGFKLQQVRIQSPLNADKNVRQSELYLSRRERRRSKSKQDQLAAKSKAIDFSMPFGSISFDNNDKSVFNVQNPDRSASVISRMLHEQSLSNRLGSAKEHGPGIVGAATETVATDDHESKSTSSPTTSFSLDESFKRETSHMNSERHVKDNYFDEVYFPAHSPSLVDEKTLYRNPRMKTKERHELSQQSKSSEIEKRQNKIFDNDHFNSSNYTAGKDSIQSDLSFVDDQYFSSSDCINQKSSSDASAMSEYDTEKESEEKREFNAIDEQYFATTSPSLHGDGYGSETDMISSKQNMEVKSQLQLSILDHLNQQQNYSFDPPSDNERSQSHNEFNAVDEQYFGHTASSAQSFHRDIDTSFVQEQTSSKQDVKYQTEVQQPLNLQLQYSVNEPPAIDVLGTKISDSVTTTWPMQSEVPFQGQISSESSIQYLKEKSPIVKKKLPVPHLESPETAYDLAMKIRQDLQRDQESELNADDEQHFFGRKRDSKGFRVPVSPVPQWDKMTITDILILLKKRIIYNNDDFLAINKPYGLASIGQKDERVSLSHLLPDFTRMLPKTFAANELHIVQGLDRDVTGTVVLAKTPEVASVLRGMFNTEGEIIQRFWAITKGVPSPSHGVIDIPIGEGKVGSLYKMVLRPQYSTEQKKLGKKTSRARSYQAVTEFQVLCSHQQSAIVECTPLTNNLKHQIRVHLASGLNTPILGDHKYSHFSKTAPQKLHREMLDLLKIRQAKVRELGLHLHCRSIILRNYNGKMIFLTTRPPTHFKESAQKLKLQIPRKHMKNL